MRIKPTSKPGQVVMELNRKDDQLMEKSLKAAETSPFKLKEIMVPIDFSPASLKALQYALPMAEKFGAKITLIHVVEPKVTPDQMLVPSEVMELHGELVKSGWKQLEALYRQAIKPGMVADTVVEIGTPYEQIVATAKTHNIDLIIIATRGYTGLKHLFIGSTAERVVRHAPCPVLTVREREQDFVN